MTLEISLTHAQRRLTRVVSHIKSQSQATSYSLNLKYIFKSINLYNKIDLHAGPRPHYEQPIFQPIINIFKSNITPNINIVPQAD